MDRTEIARGPIKLDATSAFSLLLANNLMPFVLLATLCLVLLISGIAPIESVRDAQLAIYLAAFALLAAVVFARGLVHAAKAMPSLRRWVDVLAVGGWACSILYLFAFARWHGLVKGNWGWGDTFLIEELLILLPVLISWFTVWRALEAKWAHVVKTSLLLAAPLLVAITLLEASTQLGWLANLAESNGPMLAVNGGAIFIVVCSLPLIFGQLLSTDSLPPGPLRDRLQSVMASVGESISSLRTWRNDSVANAAVVGVGPLRKICFTSALIAALKPAEVEAILWHEIGHIRRRHALIRLSLLAVPLLGLLALQAELAKLADHVGPVVQSLLLATFMLSYLAIIFGAVARRLEYDADLWAATQAPEVAENLASALERLAELQGGAAGWLHPSIEERVIRLRAIPKLLQQVND